MSLSNLTRLSMVVAISCAMGCSVKLDNASQQRVNDIIASTEASAARAEASATKAESAARSAKESANRAAAASQKADAILFRTMRK